MKQGKWVDLCNCLQRYINLISTIQSYVQITYHRQYQNDQKIGKWDTMFREYRDKNSLIGGGSFEQGRMKIGNWVDLSDGFYRECQTIFWDYI